MIRSLASAIVLSGAVFASSAMAGSVDLYGYRYATSPAEQAAATARAPYGAVGPYTYNTRERYYRYYNRGCDCYRGYRTGRWSDWRANAFRGRPTVIVGAVEAGSYPGSIRDANGALSE